MVFIVVVGCTAPFWHIIYGVSDEKGIFGYSFMSSFLYAFGNPLFMVCVGLLIRFASRQIDNKYRHPFKVVSNMVLFVGCFFMLHIFVPKKLLFNKADFPIYFYWVSMFVLAITASRLLLLFQTAIIYSEEKLKLFINNLIVHITNSDKYIDSEENRKKHFEDSMEVYSEFLER